MNKFAMTAIAALLMATPVMAQTVSGDAEVQNSTEWQNLVAKANADRNGHATDTAAVKGDIATDAAQAPAAKQAKPATQPYYLRQDIENGRS